MEVAAGQINRVGCRFLAGIAGLAWGAWATTPAYRGMWATSPRWPHRPAEPAATGHTVNVASITTRRTELAGSLRDLATTL
jgi:hypothetical protein